MRASHLIGAIVSIAVVMGAACDGKSPTAPAPAPSGVEAFLGDWTGSITSSTAGTGTLRVSLDHLDFQLIGTWASTFPDASFNQQGTASGLRTEDGMTLTLRPDVNVDCANGPGIGGELVMIVQLEDGHLVADYGALDCAASKGHIDLVKH
jgi:hypothetical protein